jgi:hypothetical protein
LYSCSKDEGDAVPVPQWLIEKIQQLEKSSIPGTVVNEYKWKYSHYYNIYSPISSCLFCDFYDYHGNRYQWSVEDSDDFQKNAVLVREVWKKGY